MRSKHESTKSELLRGNVEGLVNCVIFQTRGEGLLSDGRSDWTVDKWDEE